MGVIVTPQKTPKSAMERQPLQDSTAKLATPAKLASGSQPYFCPNSRRIGTRSAFASSSTSISPTQRVPASIRAIVKRSMSQPCLWQRAANSACESPLWYRMRRTYSPVKFLRAAICADLRTDAKGNEDRPVCANAQHLALDSPVMRTFTLPTNLLPVT